MGAYEDALAAAVRYRNLANQRTQKSLGFLDQLSQMADLQSSSQSSPSPVVGSGTDQSSSYGAYGEHSGPSRGYSTGPIPKLAHWKWHGINMTTDAAAVGKFRGLLDSLAAEGYKISTLYSYANRRIEDNSRLSEHAYGRAIDINPGANPMLNSQLRTNMPKNIAELARKYGLVWGGTWHSKKDPMHFSTTGW